MVNRLEQLRNRISNYANHYKKFLRNVENNLEQLISLLEKEGLTEQIHLWFPSVDLDVEFGIIASLPIREKEILKMLGCYYSLKYLQLNIATLDSLRLMTLSAKDQHVAHRHTMLVFGHQFRVLTRAYMKVLLQIFLKRKKFNNFVIIGVGTRSDQDDIDVGVIDHNENRSKLNRAIAKLNIEMTKYASNLHFHLSEHIVEQSFAANLDEYCNLLDQEIQDFVIISEMLGAARILGSGKIFTQFKSRVTDRYYFHPHGDNRFHEGYLRGILGEIRALLNQPKPLKKLEPKQDGLRIIKGILYALKTIYRLDEVNSWQVIDRLITVDDSRKEVYQQLECALSFYEIVRFLYQALVNQAEDIPLESANYSNLNQVAYYLGYEPLGTLEPYQQMVIQYYQYFDTLRSILPGLIEKVTEHLFSKSIFQKPASTKEKNPFIKFVENLRFFRGTGFWDDVLENLGKEKQKEVLYSIKKLTPKRRNKILDKFITHFSDNIDNLLRISLIIKEIGDDEIYYIFQDCLINKFEIMPDFKHRLISVFNLFPGLVNRFLAGIESEDQKKFAEFIKGEIPEPKTEVLRNRLINLAKIHHQSSNYFRLFFRRITNRYPDILRYLHRREWLEQFSQGVLGQFNTVEEFRSKTELLGDFYDVEFIKTALMTLSGETPIKTNAEYTKFSDLYLQLLFETAGESLDERMFRVVKDRFAVYAAGGHGREQAFDDDYDIIIVTDTEEPNLRYFANQLAGRINRELTKRGVIPHYRFAEFTGNYTISVDELEGVLGKSKNNLFVDQSQVLGSRIIIGSVRMERIFDRRILEKYIYTHKDDYISNLIAELENRHKEELKSGILSTNIKEGLGGLRDIEMFFLIFKALFRLHEPINIRIFKSLKTHIDAQYIEEIRNNFLIFKNVRDLYRLTTAAIDEIDQIGLSRIAAVMGYENGNQLEDELLIKRKNTYQRIKEVLNIFELS